MSAISEPGGANSDGPDSGSLSNDIPGASETVRLGFTESVRPEIPILLHVARSYSSADAEDLVQETLTKAFRAWDKFDGRYLRAWLLTILRNTAINAGRKKRPTLSGDSETLEQHPDSSLEASPQDLLESNDFVANVKKAILGLSSHYRTAVELVDIDGLSYQEAADVMGIPVGTIMSRLHRGRRQVKEVLAKQGLIGGEQ
jgi:RNA polymerase sigma-70 factor (ECF subfamily)